MNPDAELAVTEDLPLGSDTQARLVEIFLSTQGEGLLLGEPQIFVRFGGCNLHCDYCDEPETIPIPSGRLLGLDEIERGVLELGRETRWVSLTGGEPLLHEKFLAKLMPRLKSRGLKLALETNGVLPSALKRVEPWTDLVSMDIKLPSSTGRELWRAHEDFLRVAPAKSYVKVVLTSKTTDEEVDEAAAVVERVHPAIPFYLQPVTPRSGVSRPAPERVLRFLKLARARLDDVRLTPQWHPVWGVK